LRERMNNNLKAESFTEGLRCVTWQREYTTFNCLEAMVLAVVSGDMRKDK